MSARADVPRPLWRWLAGIRPDEVLVLQGAPFLGAAFAFAGGGPVSWGKLALFGLASGALVAHVFALNDWSEMAPDAEALPLGARPSNGVARVPSAAATAARRSGEGDAVASSSRSNNADGAAPPEPFGRQAVAVELGVAARWGAGRCSPPTPPVPLHSICSGEKSSVASVKSQLQPPRRAWISPRKRQARGPRHYSDGLLDRDEMRALFTALLALSLGLFALLGAWPLLLAAAIALLSALYSAPAVLGKGAPIASSALHLSGGTLHFLLGYSLRGAPDARALAIALFFGLTFAAGHLTQEARDRDEDMRNGTRTNAVAFGKTPVFVASLVLFTLSDALLAALALSGVVPRMLAPAIAALYPLHVVWALRALGSGLSPRDVRRLQWKYRARYAVIGILTVAALVAER